VESVVTVMEHINRLRLMGMSIGAISNASGVMECHITKIARGDRIRVRRSTAEAILSVTPMPCPAKVYIPSGPTRMLLEKMRKHHTITEVADACGIARVTVYKNIPHQFRVMARTAMKVEEGAKKLGIIKGNVDLERFEMLRSDGVAPEVAADVMDISERHVWRLEAARA